MNPLEADFQDDRLRKSLFVEKIKCFFSDSEVHEFISYSKTILQIFASIYVVIWSQKLQ